MEHLNQISYHYHISSKLTISILYTCIACSVIFFGMWGKSTLNRIVQLPVVLLGHTPISDVIAGVLPLTALTSLIMKNKNMVED